MNFVATPGSFAVGYLIGSIPFAYLIAKSRGVNILTVGSGNPGATNVKRYVSGRAGNLCFVLDAMKGLLSASWPAWIFSAVAEQGDGWPAIAGLLGAILGHSFPIFLRFRGGKGVATAMGGLLSIMPVVLVVGIAVWLVVYYSTRYVSLGSLCFGFSLPVVSVLIGSRNEEIGLAAFLAVVILVRHHANIRRLLSGTENRFTKEAGKKKDEL